MTWIIDHPVKESIFNKFQSVCIPRVKPWAQTSACPLWDPDPSPMQQGGATCPLILLCANACAGTPQRTWDRVAQTMSIYLPATPEPRSPRSRVRAADPFWGLPPQLAAAMNWKCPWIVHVLKHGLPVYTLMMAGKQLGSDEVMSPRTARVAWSEMWKLPSLAMRHLLHIQCSWETPSECCLLCAPLLSPWTRKEASVLCRSPSPSILVYHKMQKEVFAISSVFAS